jgi:hypothetical protein
MCVAQKSGPGRECSVAVDWRDCAWSPPIAVQFPAAAHCDPVTPVGRCCCAAQTSTRTSAAMFLPVPPPAGEKTFPPQPVFLKTYENHRYEQWQVASGK